MNESLLRTDAHNFKPNEHHKIQHIQDKMMIPIRYNALRSCSLRGFTQTIKNLNEQTRALHISYMHTWEWQKKMERKMIAEFLSCMNQNLIYLENRFNLNWSDILNGFQSHLLDSCNNDNNSCSNSYTST